MSNPNKAKGTAWEGAVCAFLRSAGFTEVFRLAPGGEHDAGDVGGLPDWALECRDRGRIDLAGDVRDAEMRAVKKGCRFGAAVIKKRRAHVADGYVVMSLALFVEVLDELANGRATTSEVEGMGSNGPYPPDMTST